MGARPGRTKESAGAERRGRLSVLPAGGAGGDARPRRLVQSVERALDILDTLAGVRGGLPLGALSERLGLNVSTCHHLLQTLAHRGYVTQERVTRHYRLSRKLAGFAHLAVDVGDVLQRAMPVLHALNQRTGEAIHLAVLEADELVTLAKLDSTFAVRVDCGRVGKSGALHATATGKALLAALPEAQVDAMVARRGLPRFTPHTLCEPAALRAELARVRAQGFAEDREEFQPDVHCIGAAIRDASGQVVASLSCATPTMRLTAERRGRIAALVMDAAAQISGALGCAGSAAGGRSAG